MDMEKANWSGVEIEFVSGDITAQADLDVVVNAANAQLAPGGGVAGAIHRAAGPRLFGECKALAPIAPGAAVITEGYALPNKHVVHALGPVYGEDQPSEKLLADAYRHAIELADAAGMESIAFPALSTGAFGYPMEEAARIALKTIHDTAGSLEHVRLVRFVLFDEASLGVHLEALQALE